MRCLSELFWVMRNKRGFLVEQPLLASGWLTAGVVEPFVCIH